ncbi:hypothetical protein F2Q69_00053142 [Brassica cretica]|uniref:Uncharacterized protein n=1 Tax=Brassica cretica TaxID=69181 RepID=A0A8S9N7E1_BRACR|nr:hypothetical protein F2Q69_00053142 [Brassica cretica]
MEEMKQDIAMMQTHRLAEVTTPASIDGNIPPSIDEELTPSNPIKTLGATEDRLDKRCDDMYFPFDITVSSLTSHTEAMQKEIVEIKRYIASRREASTSIYRCTTISTDRFRRKSIDDVPTQYRGELVTKVTSVDKSDTNNHGQDISDHTYAKLVRHQFNIECLEERLQNLANTTATMKDKWKRGDEAMRSFIDSTKDTKVDQPVNYVHAC